MINSSSSNIHGYETLPRNSHLKHTLSIHEITPNTTVMLNGNHATSAVFSPTKFNSLNSGSSSSSAAGSLLLTSVNGASVSSLKEIKKKKIGGGTTTTTAKELLLSPSGASNRLFERA